MNRAWSIRPAGHLLGSDDPRAQREMGRGGIGAEAVAVEARPAAPAEVERASAGGLRLHPPQVVLPARRVVEHGEMAVTAPGGPCPVRNSHLVPLDRAGAPALGAVQPEDRVRGLGVIERVRPVVDAVRVAGRHPRRAARTGTPSASRSRRVRDDGRVPGDRPVEGRAGGERAPAGAGPVAGPEGRDGAIRGRIGGHGVRRYRGRCRLRPGCRRRRGRGRRRGSGRRLRAGCGLPRG